MADATALLTAPTQLTTTAANLYGAAPANGTVVRNIHVMNTGAAAAIFYLSLGTNSTAATWDVNANRVFAISIPGATAFDWGGGIVIPSGSYLSGKSDTATTLTVTISGVTQ